MSVVATSIVFGCFNEAAQDFKYGKPFTKEVEDLFISYLQHPQVRNANLLGGEVMQQDSEVILNLVKKIKQETNVIIWMWSGYLFEQLIQKEDKLKILNYIDVLVDGQFELDKRDLNLKYMGSSNQRVIDVQKSLKQNKVIEYKY